MTRKNLLPFPLSPLLLLTTIFYLNFISRVILSPLLPVIESDLGLGHGQAGSLFFYIACGYAIGLGGSGFVSSMLSHRRTIIISILFVGASMLGISVSTSLWTIRFFLVICGIFAGLYLPSAIASLTDLISREHWGKAMAIHELGPNLGFITAPLIAEFLLKIFPWPGVLACVGISAVLMALLYHRRGWGGKIKGTPPNWSSFQKVIKNPSFGMMASFFMIAIGSSLGVYAMMPLFMVAEIGLPRTWANALIGLSRIFGILVLFFAGLITDYLGPKKAMTIFLSLAGILMLFLGLLTGPVISPILLFFQAASSACLFPVGFTILSLVFPEELRSVGVSFVMCAGFIIGGGIIPAGLGYWAEAFSFSSGFILLGVIFLCMLLIFHLIIKRIAIIMPY